MQQLQAALVGGTIASPLSGNAVKLHGILQLKIQGMGWGKIAVFLGIKLGSVIGEARPVPAVLQSRTSAYTNRMIKVAQDAVAKVTSVENIGQELPAQPLHAQEKSTRHSVI